MQNMSSMSAVDIELIHGMLSSIIAAAKRKGTEQEVINNACRGFSYLTIATVHNEQYHRKKRSFGYSVLEELPVNAYKYIDVCLKILRANIAKCMQNPVTKDDIRKGKPDSKPAGPKSKSTVRRVVSRNLGEYPTSYVSTRTSVRIKSLLQALSTGDSQMRHYSSGGESTKGFTAMQSLLQSYCNRSEGDTAFPFANEKIFGLSVKKMLLEFNETASPDV